MEMSKIMNEIIKDFGNEVWISGTVFHGSNFEYNLKDIRGVHAEIRPELAVAAIFVLVLSLAGALGMFLISGSSSYLLGLLPGMAAAAWLHNIIESYAQLYLKVGDGPFRMVLAVPAEKRQIVFEIEDMLNHRESLPLSAAIAGAAHC